VQIFNQTINVYFYSALHNRQVSKILHIIKNNKT